MIRLATGSDGTRYWRPIYIGFIKNNYVRRTLCAIASPFVYVMAACANIVALLIHTVVTLVVGVYRSLWQPLKSLYTYRNIWEAPRHKNTEILNQYEYEKRQRRLRLPEQSDCVLAVVEAHKRLRDLGWLDRWNTPLDGKPFQAYVSGYADICPYVTYEGTFPDGKYINHRDGQYGGVHQTHEIEPLLIRPLTDQELKASSSPFVDAVMAYALHKQGKLNRE